MTARRPIVALERCDDYEAGKVAHALERALSPLGGMGAFVSPGQRVMIKVNLLSKHVPEHAVTTHPALVQAVVRAVKAAGAADIAIGDSPGGRLSSAAARSLFEVTGMTAVAKTEGIRTVLLDDEVVRRPAPNGKLYTNFNVGRETVDCDVLIDLPRMKTHGFMQFTGAVKNLFGCIPGLEKAQFHVKVPDRDDFADMLVDLYGACRPALCIMDAIVAMEGEGPASGTPKHVGALLASADGMALDVVASAIAGFVPTDVYTVAAAFRRGLAPGSADDIEVVGADWREVAPASFERPARDVPTNLPAPLRRWSRAVLASRPYLEHVDGCTSCRTCEKNCPVSAITMREGRPDFDLDTCIRCYCCQELCPEHAIGLRRPWFVNTLVLRGGSSKA